MRGRLYSEDNPSVEKNGRKKRVVVNQVREEFYCIYISST